MREEHGDHPHGKERMLRLVRGGVQGNDLHHSQLVTLLWPLHGLLSMGQMTAASLYLLLHRLTLNLAVPLTAVDQMEEERHWLRVHGHLGERRTDPTWIRQ